MKTLLLPLFLILIPIASQAQALPTDADESQSPDCGLYAVQPYGSWESEKVECHNPSSVQIKKASFRFFVSGGTDWKHSAIAEIEYINGGKSTVRVADTFEIDGKNQSIIFGLDERMFKYEFDSVQDQLRLLGDRNSPFGFFGTCTSAQHKEEVEGSVIYLKRVVAKPACN